MKEIFLLSLFVWKLIFLLQVSSCFFMHFSHRQMIVSAEECWPAGHVPVCTRLLNVSSQQLYLVQCWSVIHFAVTDRFYKCGNVAGNVYAQLLIFL
jgi:hypothetical protein